MAGVVLNGTKTDRRSAISLGVTLAVLIVGLALAYAVMRAVCMRQWNHAVLALQVASRSSESLNASVSATRPAQERTNVQPPPSASVARFAGEQIVNLYNAVHDQSPFVLPTNETTLLSGEETHKKMKNIGMVFSLGDTVWVVYRGTMTKVEWDFDMKLDQNKQGVHEGFAQLYSEVKDAMLQAVAARSPRRVVVAGHSLGGALALLSALDLSALAGVSVYAFGTPRVGNQAVADALMSAVPELYVFNNDADIVPLVPLSVQPSLKRPEQPWFFAQLPQLHFHDNRGSWSANHSMDVYLAHLPQ